MSKPGSELSDKLLRQELSNVTIRRPKSSQTAGPFPVQKDYRTEEMPGGTEQSTSVNINLRLRTLQATVNKGASKVERSIITSGDILEIQTLFLSLTKLEDDYTTLFDEVIETLTATEKLEAHDNRRQIEARIREITKNARVAIEQLRAERISVKSSSKTARSSACLDAEIKQNSFGINDDDIDGSGQSKNGEEHYIDHDTWSAQVNRINPVSMYHLPTVRLKVFDGNVLSFLSWELAFDALVEPSACTALKLNLLNQYLSGEPKSMVEGFMLLQTEQAYQRARSQLKARYGNESVVGKAFLDKLYLWPKILPNNPSSLRRYSDYLNQIVVAKQNIKSLDILDFPYESAKINAKLPRFVNSKWREVVIQWKADHSNQYPPFKVLASFINKQAEIENIPELNDVGQYERSRQTSFNTQHRSHQNVQATVLSTRLSFDHKSKELINPNQLSKCMQVDFIERKNDNHQKRAPEDKRVVDISCDNTRQCDDGHYKRETAEFMRNNFNVNDGATSVPNCERAIELVRNSKRLCSKAGLRLHKFASNWKKVLETIKQKERSRGSRPKDLKATVSIERILGVEWCLESDSLCFRTILKDLPITRRSPILLKRKTMLQHLCKEKCDRDDPVPDDIQARSIRRRDLNHLKRCFSARNFVAIIRRELHHFSDASNTGYGEVPPIDLYARPRRRRVQNMTEQFWPRWKWKTESNLTRRNEWCFTQHNLERMF